MCKPSSFITNGFRLPCCVKCTVKHTKARCESLLFNISKFHHDGSDAARTVKAHITDNVCEWRIISIDDYALRIVTDNSRFALLNSFHKLLEQYNFYIDKIL